MYLIGVNKTERILINKVKTKILENNLTIIKLSDGETINEALKKYLEDKTKCQKKEK